MWGDRERIRAGLATRMNLLPKVCPSSGGHQVQVVVSVAFPAKEEIAVQSRERRTEGACVAKDHLTGEAGRRRIDLCPSRNVKIVVAIALPGDDQVAVERSSRAPAGWFRRIRICRRSSSVVGRDHDIELVVAVALPAK